MHQFLQQDMFEAAPMQGVLEQLDRVTAAVHG
jgi:hypothetical protein